MEKPHLTPSNKVAAISGGVVLPVPATGIPFASPTVQAGKPAGIGCLSEDTPIPTRGLNPQADTEIVNPKAPPGIDALS